jgi:D-alanine-D-alanine ligase
VAILGHEALPVVEIIPEGGIYTYEAKYTRGKSRYECPAQLPPDLAARVQATSVAVYDALGCEGFARVDYRLAEDGSFYCLEVNTIPGMTPLSLVPMAAKAAGLSFAELVERILELAIARGPRRRRAVAAGV